MPNPEKPQIEFSYKVLQNWLQGGTALDNDLANLAKGIGDTIDALADVRRADGALNNEIVTPDSLSPAVLDMIEAEGPTGPIGPTVHQAQLARPVRPASERPAPRVLSARPALSGPPVQLDQQDQREQRDQSEPPARPERQGQ
ncbi:hypothetical protein [Mesorhizobium sp.]|uniref:hypothetical protein n=1 Tax=Mesorhizobium sp. TaxID=1871066 RepID=UPI0025BE091A|nr:hypothetical protein [Mesorhizobium sp.]